MRFGKLIFAAVGAALALAATATAAPATAKKGPGTPEARTDWSKDIAKLWADKGRKQLAKDGAVDVIFLGDSITQLWMDDERWENGQIVWDRHYSKRKAVNFGVAGDRVEHLRYRVEKEKMTAPFQPKVFVLMIGVNNLLPWSRSGSAAEVAAGIASTVDYLKTAHPKSKILLLGILPALDKAKEIRGLTKTVNAALAKLADGDRVKFLDFGDKLLRPDGELNKELIRDTVHLSEAGYEVWAEAMNPTLFEMLR